jgi:hypothetical protein
MYFLWIQSTCFFIRNLDVTLEKFRFVMQISLVNRPPQKGNKLGKLLQLLYPGIYPYICRKVFSLNQGLDFVALLSQSYILSELFIEKGASQRRSKQEC